MAEAPKKKGKAKKLSPVIIVGGAVIAYYLYKKFSGGSSSATTPATDPSTQGSYEDSGSGGGGSGGGGSSTPTSTGTTATGTDYTGTGNTSTSTTTPPIFDTAQPGNPYGQGVAYVEPGVGDLPPGVLPVVYNPPNTTALTPASGALASNPAQGGHSL